MIILNKLEKKDGFNIYISKIRETCLYMLDIVLASKHTLCVKRSVCCLYFAYFDTSVMHKTFQP